MNSQAIWWKWHQHIVELYAKAELEYGHLHQDLRAQLFKSWLVSCDLFSRRTLMQHDDDQRDICTKGDVCDILVLNSPGNKLGDCLPSWASYKTPWHHNTKCACHQTLTHSLLSLVLLPTKLIATHHPCDSWIDLHCHTYHFSNEHHHSCSSFQRPSSNLSNFGSCTNKKDHPSKGYSSTPTLNQLSTTSIHGKKGWICNPIHDENSMLERTLELWKHFNI